MAAKCVLLFVCLSVCYFCVHCDIICEIGFCSSEILENPCASPRPDCSYNNATHSGLWLPSPTVCNCCPYCLQLFSEGSPCSLGGSGTGTTIGRCGEGLTCDNNTSTCIRMSTKCHDAQDDYDARHARGETGALEKRPSCDNKGNYASYECVASQTCFCQSEDGERIFGEVQYTGKSVDMPCICSRMAYKIESSIAKDVPYPVFGLRCTSDGNFNPVQCLGNTCYCVNIVTGEASSTETIDLEEKPVSELSCYDPELDLFPQNKSEPPYEYTTPCHESVQEREALIEESIEEGFNVDYFTGFSSISCLPDGTFGRISSDANGSKICIDERRVQIADYVAEPNTSAYTNMDCKCAITSNLMASSLETPFCCKNGNFRTIQCRRGKCYCVDSDGRQVGKENTEVTRLTCYTADWRNC